VEAKAKDLMFLSQTQKVEIPFFQRSYVWTKENWEDLLRDLSDTRRSHFLGSVIFKWASHTVGDHSSALVIDGQQRLTTLSVLLKALYDTLAADAREAARDSIRQALCYKVRPLDRDYKVRIQHSRLDRPAYDAVIRRGLLDNAAALSPDQPGPHGESLITQAYAWFVQELSSWREEQRVALLNHLLDGSNRMLVLITLDPGDDEQKIFDTINSAGVRLSSADIIKNALFQQAIRVMGEEDAISLYSETWGNVFLTDEDTRAFWDQERTVGRLVRDNLEILLHAVAVIRGFYDPEKHTMQDLGACYKGRIEALSTREGVHAFASLLRAYAQTYRKHFGVTDSTTPMTFGDRTRRLLHILDAYQISSLHPYVLFILYDHGASADRDLTELERFLVRRLIAGGEIKSLNKLVLDFLQHPERVAEKAAETSDAEVSAGLRRISNKDARIVLFWLELARRSADSRYDEVGLVFNYTLEHVMPQKWEAHWPLPPTTATDRPDAIAAARRHRSAVVGWLGNMTLLNARLNTSLSHSAFDKKVLGVGRKKGMQAYGTLAITLDDIVRPFLAGEKSWTEDRIRLRTEKLEREFLAVWPTR
jgi:hypothetical protein